MRTLDGNRYFVASLPDGRNRSEPDAGRYFFFVWILQLCGWPVWK